MSATDPSSWSELTDDELLALSDTEFDAMTSDIAALLTDGPLNVELEQPPESLWAAIAASAGMGRPEFSLVDKANSGSVIDPDRLLGVDQSLGRRPVGPSGASFRAASRWSGRTAVLTLVAACVLLVLLPLGLSLRSSNDPKILAGADLEVLDQAATAGHADLVAEGDGVAITLDVSATAPTDEYLELWLLGTDDDGELETISLGRVDGDGPYAVPADVDRSRFDTVDVSIEADDGDATHSGRSVLRGQLTS